MKRILSILAMAALMLLGMGGLTFAQDTTSSDLDKVGATGSTNARRGATVSSTPFGVCNVTVTKMPSGNTPGYVTITGASSLTFCEESWYVSAYFKDKSGRQFIVTKIGNNAFSGTACQTSFKYIWLNYFNSSLFTSSTPKNTLDYEFEIGANAFSGCSKLVSFGATVNGSSQYIDCKNIGSNAFKDCSSMTQLYVKATKGGVINASAFENCSSLSSTLHLSGSIDKTAFTGCTSVTNINWYGGYSSTLNYSSDSPMYPMRKNVKTVYLCGAVPAHFFEDFTALTTVSSSASFFDNMKNTNNYQMGIGEKGFGYCSNLQSVQVAGAIHKNAFQNCSKLTSVTYRGAFLSNSQVPTDYDGSFFYSVKDYVTTFSIEETSTSNKPNSYIPSYLCAGMKNLKKITIPDYVFSIGEGAFRGCTSLTTVSINSTTSELSVIGQLAFLDCTSLSSITLPPSIEYIYPEAFEWCESLKTCPLNSTHVNLKMIGRSAFYQAGLTSLYIPANVKTLGSMLIGGSKCNVTSITFMPKNLYSSNIGGSWANLFFGTQDMYKKERGNVTHFYLNSELTSIPDSLCWNFTGLNYLYNHSGSKTLSAVKTIGKASFAKCTMLFHNVTSLFPNLESIGESAFEECGDNFLLISLPKVKTIGNKAFKNSGAMKMSALGLQDLTSIGDEAFAGCSKLLDIVIPEKVTKVGSDAFKGCSAVVTADWNAAECKTSNPFGSVKSQLKKLNIGEQVTYIPESLADGSKVQKLTFPANVLTIGNAAFQNCTSLDSVTICSNLKDTKIVGFDNAIFKGCSKLKKAIFTGATSIPEMLFSNISSLTTVELGEVVTIGNYAFDNTCLTSLALNNVDNIGVSAFAEITALKTIDIAQKVPTLFTDGIYPSRNSFYGSTNINKITASCSIVDAVKADAAWIAVCANIQGSDTKYTQEYLDKKIGDDSWYSYNGKIEIVKALDCEGNVTLKCNPDEGYKFAYWRDNGSTENPRDFELSNYYLWYLGALCYNDANLYQTNFTVEPAGAGSILATNQYGHNRNDQRFIALGSTDRETAYLTPVELNGWYQFKEWQYNPMYSMIPYELPEAPGTYSLTLDIMENPGMGEYDPETGMWMPGETIYETQFDPDMKAVFEIKDISVVVENCMAENGSVSTDLTGEQKLGTEVTYTASPAEGFLFDKWSDGSTDAVHKITIAPELLVENEMTGMDENGDPVYIEHNVFDGSMLRTYNPSSVYYVRLCPTFKVDPNYKKKYTITVESNDEAKGTVSGGGVYEEGTEATLTATAKPGFDFVSWNDEVTENPRKVTVTGDATYIAEFIIHVNYFDITVNADPEEGGIVIGGGNYAENTEITLEAIANSGYEFVQWSDGVKTATRDVKVTKNDTYTAQFKALENFFTITTIAKPAEGGVVVGGGQYAENKVIQLAAVPNEGYEFAQWEDGVKTAVREITVTKDETYTAVFMTKSAQQYFTITTMVSPEGSGVVVGEGKYAVNTIIKLKAVANDGYEFLQWDDGNKDNPREITVKEDAVYKAIFKKIETYYTINVFSADPEAGTVIGTGSYVEGSEIQIAAMPNTGYRFKMWNDQNTDNPRTIVVEGDANYIASFEKTTDGIDNFDAEENNIRKVMIDGIIYIQKGKKLYNMLGAEVK
ncbi:MAG: leucine-rich repeat protein [Paludibacteraceae bacterium]|nr:leucine-rich repeat protein [Paludibacteraceae bacterium]